MRIAGKKVFSYYKKRKCGSRSKVSNKNESKEGREKKVGNKFCLLHFIKLQGLELFCATNVEL